MYKRQLVYTPTRYIRRIIYFEVMRTKHIRAKNKMGEECSEHWKQMETALSGKRPNEVDQFLSSWICSPLKKYLSVRSHELLFGKYWKSVFLASGWVGAFSRIYPELFPASPRGSVAGYHRWHRLDPTGANTSNISIVHRIGKKRFFSIRSGLAIVVDPVGTKKALTVIFRNWAPGEAGISSG